MAVVVKVVFFGVVVVVSFGVDVCSDVVVGSFVVVVVWFGVVVCSVVVSFSTLSDMVVAVVVAVVLLLYPAKVIKTTGTIITTMSVAITIITITLTAPKIF